MMCRTLLVCLLLRLNFNYSISPSKYSHSPLPDLQTHPFNINCYCVYKCICIHMASFQHQLLLCVFMYLYTHICISKYNLLKPYVSYLYVSRSDNLSLGVLLYGENQGSYSPFYSLACSSLCRGEIMWILLHRVCHFC